MSGATGTPDKMDNEATFSPTSGEPLDGSICEDCGQQRWRHRDGGAAYGYICPPTDTGAPSNAATIPISDATGGER